MAVKDTYADYQPVDYNAQYDPFPKKTEIPAYLIDHNRLEINPDDTLPAWQSRPDLRHVVGMTFRYQAHTTSNTNARDTLRYGSCETLSNNLMLWGFETYQEFRDHLAVRDKAWARQVWDETSCELRQESVRYLFWVPKGESHTTEPGCWAITMDRAVNRNILVWTNNQLTSYNRLQLSQQNRIVIHKEPQ
jgi:hypothetical protein